MQNIEEIFLPLVGQLVWGIRQGHGSFLTMEFGEPYRSVREPIVASPGSSTKVARNLARRRVFIVGQWHMWIQYSEWKVATQYHSAASRDWENGSVKAGLEELDGQALLSATAGDTPHSTVLEFDLGGKVLIWPRHEAARDDAQWSLHRRHGAIVTYRTDGTFGFDKGDATDGG